MSNSQWPQNNSPWASHDPNWRPTEFHDAKGRDPRAPFGQQPTPSPTNQDLEPPKRPSSSLWIVLGAVIIVAAIVGGMLLLGGGGPAATASPTPTAQASVAPSPERTGNWIPFEGNGNGTFEIVSYSWAGDVLTAKIRVEVQDGEFAFSLFAFGNRTRASYDPDDPSGFVVRSGTPYEAEVTFRMPRADSTIVLATPSGRTALNALPVKAG